MSKKKVLIILGTRPEGIKMAPVFLEMKNDERFDVALCSTGQHKEMLDQVMNFFDIRPDYNLSVMKPNQTLAGVTAAILEKIDAVLDDFQPDIVLVQGDTTTVLTGALAAFYKGIKVGHVEAGLRTWDIRTPFPEEANRVLVSKITDFHFAPTEEAKDNLIKDGVSEEVIFVTGNTVTDAILQASSIVSSEASIETKFSGVDFGKRIILVTAHRRENLGENLENISRAVREIAQRGDVEVVFPVHLNPKVREVVSRHLDNIDNVHLMEPLDYPDLVWLMNRAHIILTDSGGIQEEAPTLGKPVLVMRESTERPEAIKAGTAVLVGANYDLIVATTNDLLDNKDGLYDEMAKATNPYGDGHCSERIAEVLASS